MAQPNIVRRDKASSHPRERGRFYNGIITSVRSDGRVNVKIPALNVSYGPVMPLNTTDTSRYIKDDNVLCGFTDENNSQIVVFGSLSPKYDVFATAENGISIYANASARNAAIASPEEGRVIYLLDTDELQIYNGTEWITVIDTGNSENITASTLVATSASIGTLTVTGASTLNVLGATSLTASTSIGNISSTELSYLDGVTSAIQTQINSKAPSASPTFTGTVTLPSTTSIGSVSETELSYVDGVTSGIQTQLDTKAPLTQTIRSITTSTDTPSNLDNGQIVIINTSSGSVTITINGSLGLSAGQKIDFVWQGTATAVSFTPSGLTGGGLSSTPGLNLRARYSAASLLCTASNTYILIGDLAT